MSHRALIIIDIQNDYFPEGKFPLWNTESVLQNTERAIEKAHSQGVPVICIQHVSDESKGRSSFFNLGTPGVEIHPRVRAAAPNALIVVKRFADAFDSTTLDATLTELSVKELLVCGMMTQNCVTYTVLSKAAEKYRVTVLPDCCTTVSEAVHLFALNALSRRVQVIPADRAI